ncbi:MAG: hypothetical protein FJZ59_05890 [Chlamydiae bacterium]|nr:hypothetical protein [Chlamydiota bacterium]
MQIVTQHIDEVVKVMDKKNKERKWIDFRASSYEGAAAIFPWLPNYIIKIGKTRIEGGKILRACIEDYKLDLLEVPDQIFYEIPKSHYHLSSLRELSIGRYIEGKQGKDLVISKAHIEQLKTLINKTGVGDLKWRNLVHTSNNTIAIIGGGIKVRL